MRDSNQTTECGDLEQKKQQRERETQTSESRILLNGLVNWFSKHEMGFGLLQYVCGCDSS